MGSVGDAFDNAMADTVFDVDARVPASTPDPHEPIVQLRKLVRDLESAIAELEAGNT
jgi:Ni,Fe-hydrogenase III small subunit